MPCSQCSTREVVVVVCGGVGVVVVVALAYVVVDRRGDMEVQMRWEQWVSAQESGTG